MPYNNRKNAKYAPTQADQINVLNLIQSFGIPEKACIRINNKTNWWLKFNQGKINYLSPAKDSDDSDYFLSAPGNQALGYILSTYKQACQTALISLNSITIIPLLQVIDSRNHFNTLAIQRIEAGFKVWRIEPRSNDLMAIHKYPVQQIKATVETCLKDNDHTIEYSSIYTGQQSWSNNTQCGAHQINHTLALSFLAQQEILNNQIIKRHLRRTSLALRSSDAKKLSLFEQLHSDISSQLSSIMDMKENDSTKLSQGLWEQEFCLLKNAAPVSHNLEQTENTMITTHHEDIDAKNNHDDNDDFCILPNNVTYKEKHPPSDNLKSQETIQAVINLRFEKASTVIDRVYCCRSYGVFSKLAHSRQFTANFLKGFLSADPSENNKDPQNAALFIYGIYLSINDINSRLSKALEEAMAYLLGIHSEYKFALKQRHSISRHTSTDPVLALLKNKLFEYIPIHQPIAEDLKLSRIYMQLLSFIAKTESSFMYKVKGKHEALLRDARNLALKIFNCKISLEQLCNNDFSAENKSYEKSWNEIKPLLNIDNIFNEIAPQATRAYSKKCA